MNITHRTLKTTTIAQRSRMNWQAANLDFAYRGYLVKTHPLTADTFVWKDGHCITCVRDAEAAKQAIDLLVN